MSDPHSTHTFSYPDDSFSCHSTHSHAPLSLRLFDAVSVCVCVCTNGLRSGYALRCDSLGMSVCVCVFLCVDGTSNLQHYNLHQQPKQIENYVSWMLEIFHLRCVLLTDKHTCAYVLYIFNTWHSLEARANPNGEPIYAAPLFLFSHAIFLRSAVPFLGHLYPSCRPYSF